jgi:hypothetical protein
LLLIVPAAGLDPVDVLLLMAASENDTPKVEELLAAGANIAIADNKGKSPLELATKQEVKDLLEVRRGLSQCLGGGPQWAPGTKREVLWGTRHCFLVLWVPCHHPSHGLLTLLLLRAVLCCCCCC